MKNTIENIIEYFKENSDVFNDCIVQLDDYNGYLGDDRYMEMEMLNEFYCDEKPLDVLYRAFYGRDNDTWTTNECGDKTYGEFNPNRDFFKFNGYGNLVSSDYPDYSGYLDEYAINAMIENRRYIDAIEDDEILSALFDKADGTDGLNAFEKFCNNTETCARCRYRDCKSLAECKQQYYIDNNIEVE